MRKILAILLPTTLPTAMSVECWMAEVTDTASSGALVPNATTVSPITSGGILHFWAMPELPPTNQSAPFTSNTKPRISKKIHKYNIPDTPLFIFAESLVVQTNRRDTKISLRGMLPRRLFAPFAQKWTTPFRPIAKR